MHIPPLIQKRNLWLMVLLFLLTGGLYFFYWLYKTKQDINKLGGKIPTFWLAIIPFANFYFNYRYCQYFVKCIKNSDDLADIIIYFFVLSFFPFVAALIIQYKLNNYIINGNINGNLS